MQLQSGMKAVVIGLGAAGLSTVRFLQNQGVRVTVSEKNREEQIDGATLAYLRQEGIALETGGHTEGVLARADWIVPGPGVPLNLPIIKRAQALGLPIVGECALAAGRFTVPVIAVTGSNGKTTVTSLIGSLLKAAGRKPFIGGNIGTPLLDYFLEPNRYDSVVLELSSFQLDLAGDFRPDIGLLLNISPDHLDRHGSLDAYAAAKIKLFQAQKPGDAAILGSDDPRVDAVMPNDGVAVYRFGRKESCAARLVEDVVDVTVTGSGTHSYLLAGTKLHSSVNRLNAAAALLAATLNGCKQQSLQHGLTAFEPPPHRMAEVGVVGGVRYINDSKATNIGALEAALAGCTEPVVLIAGGRDKGGAYTLLTEVIQQKVKLMVLIGEAAPLMASALAGVVAIVFAASMEEAVHKAAAGTVAGDTVLLAPGCASYDMFSGYEERGQVFAACVQALNKKIASRV